MVKEQDVFYDRFGKPTLRLLNDGRLVGFNGKNYYFISENVIYDYNGNHIGWIEGGIIRDLIGKVLAFGENPTDDSVPFLPFKQFKPFPNFIQFEPFRPYRKFKKFKPFKNFLWSPYRLIDDNAK